MFYFRCGKETGRFKFSVKLTAPMGILTECSCFLFFTKDISILAPPKSKVEIPMCQSYVSLRKTECSFLLPADNRHGNIGSGMDSLQERRTVAGCSYGSRGNCKCLCHLVNFGKMCIYLETVNCTVLCGIRKKWRIIAHSFRQADRTFS